MKRSLILFIGVLTAVGMLLFANYVPTQAQSDDSAANVAIVQRLYEEISAGHVEVILESYAATVTLHYAGATEVVAAQALHDELAVRKAANPDLHAELHNLFGVGDLVVAELTWTTTHTGDYFGLPATGRTTLYNGLVVRRLENGKIVEAWEMFDDLAFLHSLGYTGSWDEITVQPPTICTSAFEATVHQGPSAGLALTGTLNIVVKDDGALDGQLTLADGSHIATVGQANGRAINLMLTTPAGQAIFGVGTAAQPISQCGGLLGGPFVGPQPGDSGDWVIEGEEKEPPPDDNAPTDEADEQLKGKGKPGKGTLE